MTLNATEKMIARHVLAELRQEERDYEEACRQDWAEGHRPHYCRHGMNLWVDWDPICGPCEDGLSLYDLALIRTRAISRRFEDRCWIVTEASKRGLSGQQLAGLVNWATEALPAGMRTGRKTRLAA